MRFLGTQENLTELKQNHENLIDTLLMNAFNDGYWRCNQIIMSMHEQAKAAIEQNLVGAVPSEGNLFLELLEMYCSTINNSNDITSNE